MYLWQNQKLELCQNLVSYQGQLAPAQRQVVPEDSSQHRSDMANPSMIWAMITYSSFSFSLLDQGIMVILRADWRYVPHPIKVPVAI